QQEEGAEAADAIVGVRPVEPGFGLAPGVQRGHALARPLPQLVHRPELDRLRRAGHRARRLQAAPLTVVAERALERPAVAGTALDHAERARRDAVAAAVAHVLLHDDRAELGPAPG